MSLKKNLILCIFLFCALIIPDSPKFNTTNNHGVVGIINLPSARFLDEQSAVITAYRGNPDRKITLTMMPYNWMEASLFYTSVKGQPYGSGYDQDYKDKGFNAKFRLKKQDNLPALAVGFNDLAGTGIYSSEYFVASHAIGNFDIHLGLGWGVMSGGNTAFDNFLKDIDDRFSMRTSDVGQGGNFSFQNYFSGSKMSFFSGLSYIYDNNWLIKTEYDPTDISTTYGFPERSSNYNFSLENITHKNLKLALTFERGDYFGLRFSWHQNSKNYGKLNYKNSDKEFVDSFQKLRYLLSLNNIGTKQMTVEKNKIEIQVMEYAYKDFLNLEENVLKSVSDSNFQVEEVIVSYNTAGLNPKSKNYYISKSKTDYENYFYKRKNKVLHNFSPSFTLRPFIASRESFLKAGIFFEINSEIIFKDNLFWTTNLKYPIFQNLNDLYIEPIDTYPEQVRSDIKDYLNNMGGRISLGRAQLDYFLSSTNSKHHLHLSAGIFEEMFGGFGFEYLFSNPDTKLAWGIEVFDAYKRDYDLDFDFTDYSNTTAHLNFFYENDYLIPLTLHLSYGEYLAGDKGFTLDLSRRFRNGVTMGGFFTRTNVSEELFGEGSFDKGIYFSFPITDNLINFVWRPLTKDPGSKLIRKNNLYDLTRKFKVN